MGADRQTVKIWQNMDDISKEIIENYSSFDEDNRLKAPHGLLEEEHTRRLIAKHINAAPLEIYDIGGGTGHYTAWLAELGHHVHFSDIVPGHVEIFKNRFPASANILSIGIEDARHLSYNDGVADLIILNGPLYHLTEKKDRIQVLNESKRILKQHGRLLGFAITRFAGLNYALSSGDVFNDAYFTMMKEEMVSGIRDNRALKNKTFNRAYFHLPEEIEAEFIESGFKVERSLGVVGPAWNTPHLEQAMADPGKKERLLQIAEMMEKYPAHGTKILTVGVKQ